MKSGLKKVPIHLTSAQNRLIIKNGTVVNADGEQQVDVYMEVREEELWNVKHGLFCLAAEKNKKGEILTIISQFDQL